jgi:hypothetical protein
MGRGWAGRWAPAAIRTALLTAPRRPTVGTGRDIDVLNLPNPVRTTAFGKSSTDIVLNFPNAISVRGFGDLNRFLV